MCPPLSRRRVLAVGASIGLLPFTGCQGLSPPQPTETSDVNPDEGNEPLGLAYSTGRGAFPSDAEVHSGWVHIVSDGESADLTFDVRFCAALGDVEPDLVRAGGNEYRLQFTVSADFGTGTPASDSTDGAGCSSVTRIVGGANVPSDWETLSVAVNGVDIQAIERSGTFPELRPLPDPVRPR